MFDGQRYATRGVIERLAPDVQLLLWSLITNLKKDIQLDYLQVFELSANTESKGNWNLQVVHRQEQPAYSHAWQVYVSKPTNERVFIIDDGDYATMLLASEY